MKKNAFLITKCVFMTILYLLLAFLNFPFAFAASLIGVVFSFFQVSLINAVPKKFLWTRFIIPLIPMVIFISEIIKAFYSQAPSSLIPVSLDPWLGLHSAFFLMHLGALFPIAIGVIRCNKIWDKIFLALIYVFCIGILVFPDILSYHRLDRYTICFSGLIFFLGIVVLIFPKKSQLRKNQGGGGMQYF